MFSPFAVSINCILKAKTLAFGIFKKCELTMSAVGNHHFLIFYLEIKHIFLLTCGHLHIRNILSRVELPLEGCGVHARAFVK